MNQFKHMSKRRFLVMVLGNLVVALGVAIFKISGLGNDPFNAMLLALNEKVPIHFGTLSAIVSGTIFCFQIYFGRKYIGPGTLFNTFLVGYIIAFYIERMTAFGWIPTTIYLRLIVMVIGVIVCSLGISIYQLPDLGVSPFDSLSLILSEKFPKISYIWWRMLTDISCAIIAYLLGGLVGIGTFVTMFGLGPFVQFFNPYVKRILLKED